MGSMTNNQKIDRMCNLLDLQRRLAYLGYNELHLEYLEALRFEVQEEIEKMKEGCDETQH